MAGNLFYDSTESQNNYTPSESNLAKKINVKAKSVFMNSATREVHTGTMTVNKATRVKINPKSSTYSNNSYTIPKGYHDGTGSVYTGNLSEYTTANAVPSDVTLGKTFWVNGYKKVGTLRTDAMKQEGTATAGDILDGRTAWVNGKKITGTIPIQERQETELEAGAEYTIPYGFFNGTSKVKAKNLHDQTVGDAVSTDILKNKIAWVNGEKVIGSLESKSTTMIRVLAGQTVTLEAGCYVNPITIYALFADRLDLTGTDAFTVDNYLYLNSAGYISGDTLIVRTTNV